MEWDGLRGDSTHRFAHCQDSPSPLFLSTRDIFCYYTWVFFMSPGRRTLVTARLTSLKAYNLREKRIFFNSFGTEKTGQAWVMCQRSRPMIGVQRTRRWASFMSGTDGGLFPTIKRQCKHSSWGNPQGAPQLQNTSQATRQWLMKTFRIETETYTTHHRVGHMIGTQQVFLEWIQ